jgi:competence protein ComEA
MLLIPLGKDFYYIFNKYCLNNGLFLESLKILSYRYNYMEFDLDKVVKQNFSRAKALNGILLICIVIVGFLLFNKDSVASKVTTTKSSLTSFTPQKTENKTTFFVDIEGAVTKPGVYEVDGTTRVNDVILLAGGFTKDVDYTYVTQNVNKAQKVTDAMKLYIPFINESSVSAIATDSSSNQAMQLVNINSSSKEDLDRLPGVGEVTANKIINARPYGQINDLVSKKVLTASQVDKIKDLISF